MPSPSSFSPSPASSPPPPTPCPPPSAPADFRALGCVPGGPPLHELLPGFRFVFDPTGPDMVWLLRRKVAKAALPPTYYVLPGIDPPRDLDISLFEPEELPRNNDMLRKHLSCFFTTRTNANPGRAQPSLRPTPKGCWKGTGEDDCEIRGRHLDGVVGFKKMFVYYQGKAPNEVMTAWVMEEVRLNPRWEQHRDLDVQKMQSCVMCKVYNYLKEEEEEEEETTEDLHTSDEEDIESLSS